MTLEKLWVMGIYSWGIYQDRLGISDLGQLDLG